MPQPPDRPFAIPTAASAPRKILRCGVVTDSHSRTPRSQRQGQLAPAARRKDAQSGEAQCPNPDSPHRGTRSPPLDALMRPHSPHRQLERACAVGLVSAPKAALPTAPKEQR